MPRYPGIRVTVDLSGPQGNAFAIMGYVLKALKETGVDAHECSEFIAEATSGSYDRLLEVVGEWVSFTTKPS